MGRFKRPFKLLRASMSEETADLWRDILREAIQEISTQPVIGTRFRAAIGSAASKRGLQFPPSGEPKLGFIEFLQRYPDVVSILRRPGQDFLVVAAGKSDLLAKSVGRRLYGIRPDLFKAFTTVGYDSTNLPYYDKNTDQVVRQEPGEGQALPESWVPVEVTTEAAEIQLRRDFTETPEQAATRSQLLEAVTNSLPLSAFGKAVKRAGSQREWHSFRTERVLAKIQRWATDNQIEWNDAWLTEGPSDYAWKKQASLSSPTPTHAGADPLQFLFSGLDAADIQRISIPLDLVLKAISSPKKR